VAELIEKSRNGTMSPANEEDWERYEYLEHLVRIAKSAAQLACVLRPQWLTLMPSFGNK
jgi:hypothetical protein